MSTPETIYVLGSGAIGLALSAHLADAGRAVVAVRTSQRAVRRHTVIVTARNGASQVSAPVDTVSLANMRSVDGTMVVATKSYANPALAKELADKGASGPVVVMQNGIGVEEPFLAADCFSGVYRCVLYLTSQATAEYEFAVRPVNSSPVGEVDGSPTGLQQCVDALTTDGFPLHAEENITRQVWKKTIANAVFNSICPLLDVDNGIFARDDEVAMLARDVVRECVSLTDRLELGLTEDELMDQIMRISKASDGQFISTLRDIRGGNPTEIESLNLKIAAVAATMRPRVHVPRVEQLGRLILAKSHGG